MQCLLGSVGYGYLTISSDKHSSFYSTETAIFLKNQIDESLKKLINIYFNLSYMFKSGRVSPKFSLLYTSLLFFFFHNNDVWCICKNIKYSKRFYHTFNLFIMCCYPLLELLHSGDFTFH